MTAVKWQQVKLVFGDALRRLFRGGAVAALRLCRIGSQPETQSDGSAWQPMKLLGLLRYRCLGVPHLRRPTNP